MKLSIDKQYTPDENNKFIEFIVVSSVLYSPAPTPVNIKGSVNHSSSSGTFIKIVKMP